VPVVRKLAEHHAPGGAANTAANLAALGAEVIFLSVVGSDDASLTLRSSLRASGIDDRYLIIDPVATTPHKVRILADGQYVVRFDDEQPGMSIAVNPPLLEQITQHFATCDLVVISDYGYGVASDGVIDRVHELCAEQPKIVFVDSKDLYRFRDLDATMLTPNLLEARLLVEQDRTVHPRTVGEQMVLAAIEALGRRIHEKIHAQCVAITLAVDGVLLVPCDGVAHHLPAHPVAQANDVGAGDSFLAGMALAAGADRVMAAQIGLDAAAIAVTKRWTAVVPQRELLQRASLFDAATHDQTTDSDHVLRQLIVARREGRTIVFTNGVFDILNAGHVRFLRQAKALGDVLVVGVNSNRSTQRLLNKRPMSNDERDRLELSTLWGER
jgi:D-beta-D-heptose 7-phosphate kinase/D-beta-D-heptose 1-phosphate adenosyltransferase